MAGHRDELGIRQGQGRRHPRGAQQRRVRWRQQSARLAIRLQRRFHESQRDHAHRERFRAEQRLLHLPRRVARPRGNVRHLDHEDRVPAAGWLHDVDAPRARRQRLGKCDQRSDWRSRSLVFQQPPDRRLRGQVLRPDVRPDRREHERGQGGQRLLQAGAGNKCTCCPHPESGDPGQPGPVNGWSRFVHRVIPRPAPRGARRLAAARARSSP